MGAGLLKSPVGNPLVEPLCFPQGGQLLWTSVLSTLQYINHATMDAFHYTILRVHDRYAPEVK